MKILTGQGLVNELRKHADAVCRKIWIASPYIGSWAAVQRVLGMNWCRPGIKVRLLTDVSGNGGYVDSETLRYFQQQGEVKQLDGLHAKVYILDDTVLVTSANLTGRAFQQRHEVGILVSG